MSLRPAVLACLSSLLFSDALAGPRPDEIALLFEGLDFPRIDAQCVAEVDPLPFFEARALLEMAGQITAHEPRLACFEQSVKQALAQGRPFSGPAWVEQCNATWPVAKERGEVLELLLRQLHVESFDGRSTIAYDILLHDRAAVRAHGPLMSAAMTIVSSYVRSMSERGFMGAPFPRGLTLFEEVLQIYGPKGPEWKAVQRIDAASYNHVVDLMLREAHELYTYGHEVSYCQRALALLADLRAAGVTGGGESAIDTSGRPTVDELEAEAKAALSKAEQAAAQPGDPAQKTAAKSILGPLAVEAERALSEFYIKPENGIRYERNPKPILLVGVPVLQPQKSSLAEGTLQVDAALLNDWLTWRAKNGANDTSVRAWMGKEAAAELAVPFPPVPPEERQGDLEPVRKRVVWPPPPLERELLCRALEVAPFGGVKQPEGSHGIVCARMAGERWCGYMLQLHDKKRGKTELFLVQQRVAFPVTGTIMRAKGALMIGPWKQFQVRRSRFERRALTALPAGPQFRLAVQDERRQSAVLAFELARVRQAAGDIASLVAKTDKPQQRYPDGSIELYDDIPDKALIDAIAPLIEAGALEVTVSGTRANAIILEDAIAEGEHEGWPSYRAIWVHAHGMSLLEYSR